MGKLFAIAVAAAALALAGCGSSGDETATIGTSEVTISEGEVPDTFPEFMGVLLEKTPYLPSFSNCLERQVEKAIPEDEEEELLELDDEEAEKRITELFLPASRACEKPGEKYIDPNATDEELDLLRSSQAVGLGMVLKQEGTPDELVECLERGVGDLSADDLIALIEGSLKEREALLEAIAVGCEKRS